MSAITLIPGLGDDRPTKDGAAGAWAYRLTPTLAGIVADERKLLGTARAPQPRRAMLFNGTDQYVVRTLATPVSAFPFSMFGFGSKSGTSTKWAVSLGSNGNSNRYFTLGFNQGTAVTVLRRNTTEIVTTASFSLATGWYSFVVVFDSDTTAQVYRNGVLVASLTGLTSVSLSSSFDQFIVAQFRTTSPSSWWDGYLQHCGMTRTALTLADAQTFHATGIMPGAEILLPLDSNSTTVAYNIGSSGGEATIVNGAAGMLHTGRDVKFSRQNSVGYSTRRNLLTHTEAISSGANGWTINGTGVETEYPGEGRGLNVTRTVAGSGFGVSATKSVTLSGATTGIQHTFQIRMKWVSGPTTVQLRAIESGGATGDEGSTSGTFNLTSSFQTLTLSHTVVRNDRTGLRFFAQSTGAGDYVVDTVKPQQETGATANTYQKIGADPGTAVLFPATIADPTKSVATDALQFAGVSPFDAQLESANCFTFDGADDYISLDVTAIAGSEAVANGGFDSGANWTLLNGGVISGGKLEATSLVGGAPIARNTGTVTAGKIYEVVFTVSDITGGGFSLGIAAATQWGTSRTTNGTFTEVLIAPISGDVTVYTRGTTTTGKVDNVSVRELPTPSVEKLSTTLATNGEFSADTNWIKGTGWTIAGGVAVATAVAAFIKLQQTAFPFKDGRKYKVTFTVVSVTSGGARAVFTGGTQVAGTTRTTTGTYVEYLITNAGNNIFSIEAGAAGFDGTIDNVIVEQVAEIESQGTSALSYRSTGDGFTGTAGTAYDINLGSTVRYPCSEGSGSTVYNVKTNTLHGTVVNGQANNRSTLQNSFHWNTVKGYTLSGAVRIPASETSPTLDAIGGALSHPAVAGLNGAESKINFSPVALSWSDVYSIPGADIAAYAFDGSPGSILLGVNAAKHEGKFRLNP